MPRRSHDEITLKLVSVTVKNSSQRKLMIATDDEHRLLCRVKRHAKRVQEESIPRVCNFSRKVRDRKVSRKGVLHSQDPKCKATANMKITMLYTWETSFCAGEGWGPGLGVGARGFMVTLLLGFGAMAQRRMMLNPTFAIIICALHTCFLTTVDPGIAPFEDPVFCLHKRSLFHNQ